MSQIDDFLSGKPTRPAPDSIDDFLGTGSAKDKKPADGIGRSAADIARDIGVTALKGAIGLPQAVVGLADIPTGGRVGKFLEESGYRPGDAQKIAGDWYSDAQKAANQKVEQADGFVDTLQTALENPSTIATAVGESLPQMLGGAGVARGLIKVAPKLAPWAAGAIGEGVMGAGSAASQTREQTADGLLTPMQSAAAVGSGIGTAALGAAGGRLAQRAGIGDVDTLLAGGRLAQSPKGFVRQVFEAGISEGVFEELPQSIQEQVWQNFALGKPITEGVDKAAAMGLLAGAAMGMAGGGYNAALGGGAQPGGENVKDPIEDPAAGAGGQPAAAPAAPGGEAAAAPGGGAGAPAGSGVSPAGPAAGGVEAAGVAGQRATFDLDAAENSLIKERDGFRDQPTKTWSPVQRALYDAVTTSVVDPTSAETAEMLRTAIDGGRLDLAQVIVGRAERAAQSTHATPGVSPGSPKYAAIKANLDARKGEADSAAKKLRDLLQSAIGQTQPTEAERALRQPVQLTALDRVNEIDVERTRLQARLDELAPANGYGPSFDAERAEVAASLSGLTTEREGIARTWPKAQAGTPTTFSTEAGARLDGQYALMDAADLVTSHDEGLRPNPLYPAELQPRDRTRSASELQVSSIVQKLDPARLGISADAATGAPIVGADGLVESGNARTIALKRIYQAQGQKAAEYRAWLQANAGQFGITPESVNSMEKPVLVRVRSTPVNRAEFARQANASTVQRMAPAEQALSDAKRITSLEGLNPDEDGEFVNSRDFIRQFMGMLPITEQSDMIESDGRLSTFGYRRIQNAVLAKAYGDSPTLRRMTEAMDDNLRNVSKALTRVAPTIAAARERMQAGTLYEADIAPDLVAAVEGLSSLKDKGWKVDQELGQSDLTGPKYSPEASDLLRFLSDNIRSPRRIAEFLQRYYEALEAAGDPSQGSLLGDAGPAPARADLLNFARGDANGTTDRQQAAGPAEAGGRQPGNAPGGGPGDQGNGAAGADAGRAGQPGSVAGEPAGEWVAFPPESGTLGIPRAEMPQVKGEHRGALVQFLAGRGIDNERMEVPPYQLKPTQAEFSTKKAAKWAKVRDGSDRSVLISSDDYVLDGHHQWVAAQASNEPVQAIRFNAPIRDLLSAVREFPSVQRSEGATDLQAARAAAVQDFKAAMADLGDVLTRHQRAAMVPENLPGLMPVLVRLAGAAVRIVGTDIRRVTKWVREQLKADPTFKTVWNKVGDDLIRKAALQAMEQAPQGQQTGLFDSSEAATDAVQGGLFDALAAAPAPAPAPAPAAPKVATINGRPYDMDRDNFKPPATDTFIAADILERVRAQIRDLRKAAAPIPISAADRARAEAMLKPLIRQAEDSKAEYDQKVIDIAKKTGALGQMLATVKSLDSATRKLATDPGVDWDMGRMFDTLRSTIVVSRYDDAQAVLDAIRDQFDVLPGRVKNMTDAAIDGKRGKFSASGYGQVLVNVKLPNAVIAEIQINVPEMLAVKMAEGHALYEIERAEKEGSKAQADAVASQQEIYPLAASAAAARNDSSSDRLQPGDMGRSLAPVSRNSPVSSSKANTRPSGNLTSSVASPLVQNSQPGGNLSGSFIESSPNTQILPRQEGRRYNGDLLQGEGDANQQRGEGRAQGEGAGAVPDAGEQGRADPVRQRPGRPDRGSGDDTGRSDRAGSGVRPAAAVGPDEGGRGDEQRQGDGTRGSVFSDAGVPAGRDIAPKSGLNYEFGPQDLTYEGSWARKAEQNVAAVELLKKLEAEGRQATREEQVVLAKFIGWGSSEMANNLFDKKKLEKIASTTRDIDAALADMDRLKRDFLRKGGRFRGDYADSAYYSALAVLREAGKLTGPSYAYPEQVTRAELEAARPPASARRWLALRARLEAVMSEQDLAEAARSTQYAHYTSKAVVRSMWAAMDRMGFKGGTILEPGAGIGVFPGLMPHAMATNSAYTGIEFDSMTGGILRQLFPDERILVESFVDSKLPKNFYDAAVGNPPFSGSKILGDPEYAKRAFSLHDYFFAKTIDRVKPGGLVVFVTSRYTLDKLDDKARAYLAERADLVGAIRLPQTAFKQNAGTEVVTDVIFLRKKVPGETFEHGKAWAKSVPVNGPDGKPLMVSGNKGEADRPATINEYFVANPEMVLGRHSNAGSMYKDKEYTVTPMDGDIEAHFAKAVERLPADIYQAERGSSAEAAKVREIDFNPKAKKEGNFYVTDAGVVMSREDGVGVRVDGKSEKDLQVIRDFVPVRDALKQAQYDQLNDGDWEASLAALRKAYDAFVGKHGRINQFTTKTNKVKAVDEDTGETFVDEVTTRRYTLNSILEDDPDWTLVQALEEINEDAGEIKPSAFLSERVLGKAETASINSPSDALLTVLNDTGTVDVGLIAQRVGMDRASVIESLGAAIYEDPSKGWQTSDEYLSGNVRRKLDEARAAAKSDRRFERNVSALEAAQPAPKTPSQINPGLGENWIPSDVYARFLFETAGVKTQIAWNDKTRQWSVQEADGGKTLAATQDWGTDRRNATDLLEHALTGRPVRIVDNVGSGADKKTVFNAAATEAANQKLEALRDAFAEWIWRDSERTDRLVRIYNDRFNTTVPRSFDGRHLSLPGTSKLFNVFDHVKRGAWRIIQRGNTYLAHAVGSGKTFQMVIAAMEQKRLGLVKKPMVVVPNHMLKQFASEWQQLYPAARLMVADEANFHTSKRKRFVSRVALSDLDGVIITHSAFKLLDLDPEFKRRMIDEQLVYMRAALDEAESVDGGSGRKSPTVKQIEKQIENLENKLEAALSSVGKDTNARFDELGVDFLMVDEAHEFRKLDFATARQVKGISPQGSARALDLYMKARYLDEKSPGRSLVMASGTPITNTLAELYTVQRFMDRQTLEDAGIEDFDSWAATFGRERTSLEPNAAGKYEPVTRFTKFVKVGELTKMFREFADVLTSDNLAALLGDKRPKLDSGSRKILVTPKTADYDTFQKELAARVEASRQWKPSKDEPNNPDPIIKIIGDGRLAAIDMRFIDPQLPSDQDSKLNRMIDDVIAKFRETADMEYLDKKTGKPEPAKGATMMVFSDLGFGAGVAESRGFNARAWFEKRLRDAGVPMNQVAFMSDHKASAKKLALFKDVNAGRVRVLVGSSKNMGTGVNAQQRLKALFHLDSPWFPADLEQREGRIIRQGNKNPKVQVFAYAAKGSYDENMWKMLASKQYFIDQAMSGDESITELEDLDSQSQYDLAAAMVAEDPRVMQLAGAKAEVEKLQRLYRAHEDSRIRMRDRFNAARLRADAARAAIPKADALAQKVQDLSGDKFRAKVGGKVFSERAEWAGALVAALKNAAAHGETAEKVAGDISGFPVTFTGQQVAGQYLGTLWLQTPQAMPLLDSATADPNPVGLAMRAQNAVADVARAPARLRSQLTEAEAEMDGIRPRLEAPFPMAGMLADKIREAQDLEVAIAAGDAQPPADDVDPYEAAMGAAAGMIPPRVFEPGAAYNAPYETDLFGNPVPSQRDLLSGAGGGSRRATGRPAAQAGNVQPAAAIPAGDTPAPAGRYSVRTIVGTEVQRKLGADRILTPADAARATAYLYKSPVERFDGIVTDKDGKPLAVVGGFKGAISQTSVFPGTIVAEAIRVPGAAAIWFSHNHPSGTDDLSPADFAVASLLAMVFDGSGIEAKGLLAVTGERYSFTRSVSGETTDKGRIPDPGESVTVPVIEREMVTSKDPLDKVTSPEEAKIIARKLYDEAKQPGIMGLDAQHGVIAWVPLPTTALGKLRNTGGLNAIYRAVSEGNLAAAILVHGSELNAKIEKGSLSIANNIAGALSALDVRVLDVINPVSGESYASRGIDINLGMFLSRSDAPANTGAADIKALRAMADRLRRTLPRMPKVNVLATPAEAPQALRDYITRQGAWGDVDGAMHAGEFYLFAANIPDVARAEHILAEHEAAHYGLRAVLGKDALAAAMRIIHAQNGRVRRAATELQARGRLTDEEATEEVIVDIPAAELARLKGWRQVVAKVRDGLARMGFTALAERLGRWLNGTLSDQQRADLFVADLVRAARGFMAGQGPAPASTPGGVTRLSGSLADDIQKQEAWLQAEARARGFKDIEDLVDRNYPLFEKLAKLWRERNPADEGVLLSRFSKAAVTMRIAGEVMAEFGMNQDNMLRAAGVPKYQAKDQTQTEAFKRWFGDSKAVDAEGTPLVVYHGTNKDIAEFKPGRGGGAIWFASSPELANMFVGGGRRSMGEGAKKGSAVYPAHLSIKKPLDLGNTAPQDNLPVAEVLRMAGLSADDQALRKIAEANLSSGYAFVSPSNPDPAGYLVSQYQRPNSRAANTLDDPGLMAALQEAGFDGLRMKEEGVITYAAFKPEQIKSAIGNSGTFDPENPDIRMSRAPSSRIQENDPRKTAAERADEIIRAPARGSAAPLDAVARTLTRVTGIERLAGAIYDRAGDLLARLTPETVKAGVVSDYGVPEAVIDQRVMLQGRQRVQLRKTGDLVSKLATLTRAESRIAYEWMNMDGADPRAYVSMMQGLPEESVKVLQEVQRMIDQLSQEAVRLGQLDPEAYKRHKFAYLRRSYAKHVLAEATAGEKAKRARVISILGDQYKGRGLVQAADMAKVRAAAPDWWRRKLQAGKADASLKGEKFIRLDRRAASGEGTTPMEGIGDRSRGRVLEVAYWPAGERIPVQYASWDRADTWEVRDIKGGNLVLWRDFTKDERERMGEVDEARFAIARTLQGMIHDVEVGRYLEWMATNQAKKEGETIPGEVVDARDLSRIWDAGAVFAPGTWVKVPETKIPGTTVAKYGKLAGRYLPGPVWNDVRQVTAGRFKPFGEFYGRILSMWKTSKTALSPAVHMNNVMSNFVMADWHDVSAAHVSKALRIIVQASQKRTGAQADAAREILNRYADSGGDTGSWATNEIARDQLEPLLADLEKELTADGANLSAQAGVYAALQHAMARRFPEAWESLKASKPGAAVGKGGGALIDLYQREDDVFRLAAWLKAKEAGADDLAAGKRARTSFLDYSINAPWVAAMRNTGWPFIAFSYRAIPMLLETAGKKPHKLLKLMAIAGGVQALGLAMAGGDGDDEERARKMLPEEKAGAIWGVVPKLLRMPWNDEHGSPVYLDVRRWVPVGDVFDIGQGQAALPLPPAMYPGGPIVVMGEVLANKSMFTGKPITLETDTPGEKATKVIDHLYKAFAPNILGLPGTYATTGVVDSIKGRTDAFGREMSTTQAVASAFGMKLGSYPEDVLRRNLMAKTAAEAMEIDRGISQLKRQRQTNRIDAEEFSREMQRQNEKNAKLLREAAEKMR